MAKPSISLARLKEHLRVDHDEDDASLALFLEAAIDRTLQEISLAGVLEGTRLDPVTARESKFGYPVASVSAVSKNGTAIASGSWTLTGNFDTGHTLTIAEGAWDAAAEWECAWTPGIDPLPAWFIIAALFLATHYYENRSTVVIGQGVAALPLPQGFEALCRPHRRVWFA